MGDEIVRALIFSFSFAKGDYWSIMGSSGSGKSTLLNILSFMIARARQLPRRGRRS